MFATYVTDNFHSLRTTDPLEPLDDLEPLGAAIGDARVVAIGESAHWVPDYTLLRHRLTRFLAERHGFTVFALESGFSEGLAVNAWMTGGSGDLETLAVRGLTNRMGRSPQLRDHLAWMRASGMRFAGLDLPGSAASPLPLLRNLRRSLDGTGGREIVEALLTAVTSFAGDHALPAYAAYAALDRAERDAMTALWAELSAWCDTRVPSPPSGTRHEVRLGILFDQMMRGHAARTALAASARDRAMAETVFWLLDRYGPDVRIVLGAANGHLQRTPISLPGVQVAPTGHHLADRLGEQYLSVALTAIGGRTPTRRADPSAPGGVLVTDVALGAPAPGSVEAALPPDRLGWLDLRGFRGQPGGPSSLRVLDAYLPATVADAHDVVVSVPSITAD